MGNKTIYVRDDALWERAKRAAGAEGISSLVVQALESFLRKKENERNGLEVFRIQVGHEIGPDRRPGPTGAIAFEGRLVRATYFHEADINLPDVVRGATVYQTKGGRLILVVDESPQNTSLRYAVYTTLRDLQEDPVFREIDPVERAKFLDEVAKELDDDWAVWID